MPIIKKLDYFNISKTEEELFDELPVLLQRMNNEDYIFYYDIFDYKTGKEWLLYSDEVAEKLKINVEYEINGKIIKNLVLKNKATFDVKKDLENFEEQLNNLVNSDEATTKDAFVLLVKSFSIIQGLQDKVEALENAVKKVRINEITIYSKNGQIFQEVEGDDYFVSIDTSYLKENERAIIVREQGGFRIELFNYLNGVLEPMDCSVFNKTLKYILIN